MLFSALFLSILPLQAMTLNKAFEAAKKVHISVTNGKLDIEVAELNKQKVRRESYPTLSVSSNSSWRDLSGVKILDSHRHLAPLNLSQPLYSGGALTAGLEMANSNKELKAIEVERLKRNLFVEVGNAFFGILEARKDLQNLQRQKKTLLDRIQQLEERAKIGRSKSSEVLASLSQRARVAAQIANKESELASLEGSFEYLTGASSENLKDDRLWWKESTLKDFQPGLTPEVRALEKSLTLSEARAALAKSDIRPELDLEANYYLDNTGYSPKSNWDLGLQFSWTLYDGRKISKQVAIEEIEQQKLRNQIEDEKTKWMVEFRTQSRLLRQRKNSLTQLKKGLNLARQNYQEQNKEFDAGLVTNLDVLRALDDLHQIQRSYDQQLFKIRLAELRIVSFWGVQ